jgi:hypothetical protein
LNAVKNGGSQTSQEFVLKKDETLTSKQFSKEGFDQHSIIFAKVGIETLTVNENSTEFSQFVYTGATQIRAKAAVYCEATGESLDETLVGVSLDSVEMGQLDPPSSLCSPEREGQYQPCCLVVLKRA